MIGQKIGAYRLKRELGHGAFGVVYEADEEFDGRAFARVAVKIIKPRDAKHRASIIGELGTLANFRHPHIVGYRAFGELVPDQEGEMTPVYIVLELADGGTLTAAYKKDSLTPRQLLTLARDVADGLAFIARRGWTHRDIKPDNLLRFESDTETYWKISDLGLARPTIATDATRAPSGTLHYMAPEAWHGLVAPSNDVWALGLCLREAVTRQRLWSDIAPGALPYVLSEDENPIDVQVVPLPLRNIIAGCLQRDPAQRWSAAQVAEQARHELAKLPEVRPDSLVVSPTGEGNYTQIAAALAAAADGSRITIMPGHYRESLLIERDVQLVGFIPQNSSEGVIIESVTGNVLKISGGHITLENLVLCGTAKQNNKKFHAVAITGARVALKNCHISNDSLAGVVVGQGAHVTLSACRLDAIATEGVLVQESGRVAFEGGRIANCGRNGIATRNGARLEARQLAVGRCKENGIHLGAGTVAYLLNCKFIGNTRNGVRVESTTLARMENCEAQGNGYGAWEIAIGAEVSRIKTRPA